MDNNYRPRALLWAAVGAGVANALIATFDLFGAQGCSAAQTASV